MQSALTQEGFLFHVAVARPRRGSTFKSERSIQRVAHFVVQNHLVFIDDCTELSEKNALYFFGIGCAFVS